MDGVQSASFHTPYCEWQHKTLSPLLLAIYDFAIFVFASFMSLFSSSFEDCAEFHFSRAFSHMKALKEFDSELIDFQMNRGDPAYDRNHPTVALWLDQLGVTKETLPIINSEGFCSGMSLEWAIRMMESTQPTLLKKGIAVASESSEIATLRATYWQDMICALSKEERESLVEQCEQGEKSPDESLVAVLEVWRKTLQKICSTVGHEVGEVSRMQVNKETTALVLGGDLQMMSFFQKLQEGIYVVIMTTGQDPQHVTAFAIEGDEVLFYEPGLGVAHFKKDWFPFVLHRHGEVVCGSACEVFTFFKLEK